jgi:BirA family biotin operon repressor/biotin-[acetyl-CoA-carboxylase] ligase
MFVSRIGLSSVTRPGRVVSVNLSLHILRKLHGSRSDFVSNTDLLAGTSSSLATVSAEIESLRRLGYDIESHPHFGCRLRGAPDRLMADDLLARISDTVIGSRILVFQQTGSTNDVVARQGADGVPEGLVVFAESQTAGRGRQGRTWQSPSGKGLWFSVLLRPSYGTVAAGRLTVAASVAVAGALGRVGGVDARIKWPNDITVRGRKMAGILTELHQPVGKPMFAVLGIGIDVNCAAADFPLELRETATSLSIETGTMHDRAGLATEVLRELDGWYRQSAVDFDAVIARWAELSTTLGRHLSVRVGSATVEGFAQALDSDGALLVRHDNGRVERIVSGDVVKQRA